MTTITIDARGEHAIKEFLGAEDYKWVEQLADMDAGDELFASFGDDGLALALMALADTIWCGWPHGIEAHLEANEQDVLRYGGSGPYAKLMRLGLEFGVAQGDGACCNYLGACYDLGGRAGVEQDYQRAKELYEEAERLGVPQATVNLGYVYEYGRTGERNFQKAFNQYAKAVAMYEHPEALYKLGDMYARGRLGVREPKTALRLYERSLQAYGNDQVQGAQPAFRIAQMIGDRAFELVGIEFDPLRALELYQLAERGLRIDVARGQVHYAKRLQEAIEGQERMREELTPELLLERM